jgi:hypothetical protein
MGAGETLALPAGKTDDEQNDTCQQISFPLADLVADADGLC